MTEQRTCPRCGETFSVEYRSSRKVYCSPTCHTNAGTHNPRYRHGMSKTLIYKIWVSMLGRCENPDDHGYANYGGRGITVCERWHVFENFYADMGDRPEGKSLDRVDNDGPYAPENCRWATRAEQRSNQRTRTVCRHGHELTVENTYAHNGKRHCRECRREWKRQRRTEVAS
jgi:hypothetical protein